MIPGQEPAVRELYARFADELSAHRYLEKILWPDGMRCPRCGSEGRIGRLNGDSTRVGAYKCYACRKSFSVAYGTLFSASHVPVHKWLQAIYLTDGGTKPIRPHHLQQVLNVSFKTASSIIRRLSEAAAELDDPAALAGDAPAAEQPSTGMTPAPQVAKTRPTRPKLRTTWTSSASAAGGDAVHAGND
jgi:transposase-like protein